MTTAHHCAEVVHDVLVDPLLADPRTRQMGAPKATRKQLTTLAHALFAELYPSESVSWAVTSNQPTSPGIVVLTSQRLLVLPLFRGQRARQAAAPYRVELGKKRLIGRVVEVTDGAGAVLSLLLSTDEDVSHVLASGASSPQRPPDMAQAARNDTQTNERAPASGTAMPLGAWRWSRGVLSWQDAELLAADHMRHLGFAEVLVTPAGRDGGLDVVAPTAGAQVKHLASPTGSPDVQRLAGAANTFTHKLFYATGYTSAAIAQADALTIALFQYDEGGNLAPVNGAAQSLGNRTLQPAPKRNFLGQLDFEGRQMRAMRWAQQIQKASETPISNRKRKGAKQLAAKEQALRLVVSALAFLEDSNNTLYKRRRQQRTLDEAEKSLKQAAMLVGVTLR